MVDSDSRYDIAIIMPVLNEAEFIGQTLEQVYHQDFPMDRVEVVIADGGSTDNTREIALSFKDRFGSLKVLDNPGRKPSSGRNVGVKNSTAPYILVLDGHCYIPGNELLKDVVATFRETGADCLCRPQPLMPPDISEFQMAVALCRDSALGHKPGSEIYADHDGFVDPTSSGAMWTRSVFERIGYFDEDFDACEDVDFNFRVHQFGMKAYLSTKLTVYYYPRASITGLWRQMSRYGLGRFRFARKHTEFSPIQWVAAAGVVGFVLFLLLSLVSDAAESIFVTATGLYLLLIIFYSLYLMLARNHTGCLIYGPLLFPTIHFGLGVGFLMGIIERFRDRPHPAPPIR